MNSLSRAFFLAIVLVLAVDRNQTKTPAAISLAIILFFSLFRLTASGNTSLQPEMAFAFSFNSVMFGYLVSLSYAVFAYLFSLSISHLANPRKGSPDGCKPTGMIYKTALAGFVIYSASQAFGAAWALTGGWGDLWVWGSSHVFSAVVWIFYASILHVPGSVKMPEKTMAALGTAGFSIIVLWTVYYEFIVTPAYLGYMMSF